jgi:hypothetical protein
MTSEHNKNIALPFFYLKMEAEFSFQKNAIL